MAGPVFCAVDVYMDITASRLPKTMVGRRLVGLWDMWSNHAHPCPIIHFFAFLQRHLMYIRTYVRTYILYIYIYNLHTCTAQQKPFVHCSWLYNVTSRDRCYYVLLFTYARNISMILCDQRGNVLKLCKSSTYRYVEVCFQGPLGLGCKTCDGVTIQAWQCIDFTFIYCILPMLNCL